jgi:hypothetical protein
MVASSKKEKETATNAHSKCHKHPYVNNDGRTIESRDGIE